MQIDVFGTQNEMTESLSHHLISYMNKYLNDIILPNISFCKSCGLETN